MADDTLTAVAKALAGKLTVAGTGGLTGYAFWPDDFGAVVPAVALVPKSLTEGETFGGGRKLGFVLVLFAARASDGIETGTKKLFTYLDGEAAGSIKKLIDADTTLSKTCEYCSLVGWDEIRLDYVLTPNGPQYIGAIGTVEIAI